MSDAVDHRKNVVHVVRKQGLWHYNSFVFPDRFLKFHPGGPAERLVDRIVGQSELPVLAIRSSAENRPVLQALRKLSRLEERKNETDSYVVLVALCGLWLTFSRTIAVPERQLHQTEEAISTIAVGVGFNPLSHFGRCSREKTGLTPGAYRKSR